MATQSGHLSKHLARQVLLIVYLSLLIGLYLASLIGVFFLSDSAVLLGALAFLLMFIVGVMQQGFQRRAFRLKLLWKFVFPCFAALFLAAAMLSWSLGAPRMEKRPVFAQRDHYYFTRGAEVSRVRFVATGACFYLAWHLLAIAFAAEQWAAMKTALK